MNFKNFRLNIVFRVALIIATVFLFYYSFSSHYFFTSIIVGIALIILVVLLIYYIDKTNRELSNFIESIHLTEFTRTINLDGMGATFNRLNTAFNEVINDFQRVRSEKEEHAFYLQTILQNIDVSVIAFCPDGSVELINESAKKLFRVSRLRNIQGLDIFSTDLVNTLFKIRPGQNQLVKVQDDEGFLHLTIFATNFKIKNQAVTLVTIQDIQNVLEEQETEAWQKLIRVLTHEIMNSIAPISSISTTLTSITNNLPKDKKNNRILDKENLEELNQALKTIHKRSDGLLHFVNTYRNLTKIPQPNFTICKVQDILNSVKNLMIDQLKENHIELVVHTEPASISFTADCQLIEQVLINLVKNSAQVMTGRPNATIKLSSFYNKRNKVCIQVSDNGPGILPEVLEKIFIPFFTTKTNGSGIGLSLSRQILKLHNGSITAHSTPDKETVFTLSF